MMKVRRFWALLLAMVLLLGNMPVERVSAMDAELKSYIDASHINWDQLKWQNPDKGHIFGSANQYALFTFGDFTVKAGSEIAGKSAVGGVFKNRADKDDNSMSQIGMPVGPGSGITSTYNRNEITTVVGDHMDGSFQGSIHGWIASANPSDLSANGENQGQLNHVAFGDDPDVKPGWYIPGGYTVDGKTVSQMIQKFFSDAKSSLQAAARKYMNTTVGSRGITKVMDPESYCYVELQGTNPNYNVFEISTKDLNAMKYLKIDVPEDSYVQINVVGSDDLVLRPDDCVKRTSILNSAFVSIVSVDNGYSAATGKDSVTLCQRIFWNMPDVKKITTEASFPGSVLAPNADLQMNGQNMNGTIIVNSAVCNNSSGEFHYYPFDYSEMPDITPAPSAPELLSIKVTKNWVGADNIQNKEATFCLRANGQIVRQVTLKAPQTEYTFKTLKKNDKAGNLIQYTVTEKENPDYLQEESIDAEGNYTFTNTLIDKITIPVEKKWVGEEGGPVTVHLKNGDKIAATLELSSSNSWKGSFENVDKYNENGETIKYTVMEEPVDGYESAVIGSTEIGFEVINTQQTSEPQPTPEFVSVSVAKEWIGKQGESATFRLYQNDIAIKEPVTVSKDNHWKAVFADLPAKDTDGIPYQYTVKEVEQQGYKTEEFRYAKNGYVWYVFKNIECVDIGVRKQWEGSVGDSAEVTLYADGTKVGSQTITENGNWRTVFQNMPKFDIDGKRIRYTLEETPIAGYTSEITGGPITGFNVRNMNMETVDVSVKKEWVGGTEASAEVNLYADGVKVNNTTLTADNGWTHTFTGLSKYNLETRKTIQYTIQETEISGYTSEITGSMESGFTVTNTKNPEPPVESDATEEPNIEPVVPETTESPLVQNENARPTTPQTGDGTHVLGLGIAMAAACAGVVLTENRRRKH